MSRIQRHGLSFPEQYLAHSQAQEIRCDTFGLCQTTATCRSTGADRSQRGNSIFAVSSADSVQISKFWSWEPFDRFCKHKLRPVLPSLRDN